MFHPVGHPLERGWVGRVDGDRVVHLAAQTLQSFFTGGASAREHAEYALAESVLVVPVLHPPCVRVFESDGGFAFANPAAVVGPHAEIEPPDGALLVLARLAAVVGADEEIGGTTLMLELRSRDLPPPKDRDFALALGPVVVTPDSLGDEALAWSLRTDRGEEGGAVARLDWEPLRALAARGTHLRPGDVLAAPPFAALPAGERVALSVEGIGALDVSVSGRS